MFLLLFVFFGQCAVGMERRAPGYDPFEDGFDPSMACWDEPTGQPAQFRRSQQTSDEEVLIDEEDEGAFPRGKTEGEREIEGYFFQQMQKQMEEQEVLRQGLLPRLTGKKRSEKHSVPADCLALQPPLKRLKVQSPGQRKVRPPSARRPAQRHEQPPVQSHEQRKAQRKAQRQAQRPGPPFERLFLWKVDGLTNPVLRGILQNSEYSLKKLTLHTCSEIDCGGLMKLPQGVEKLVVHSCPFITCDGLVKFFAHKRFRLCEYGNLKIVKYNGVIINDKINAAIEAEVKKVMPAAVRWLLYLPEPADQVASTTAAAASAVSAGRLI